MPNQPAKPNTPQLSQLMAILVPHAKQLGITTLIITGIDPVTNEPVLFATLESMHAMRDYVENKFVEKCGLVGETAWES